MIAANVIHIPGPNGPLAGAMLTPPVPGAPVVLIVPGSGPTDRDGNSPLGIRSSTYRMIAEGLAARGVASVRIDKRGLFGSSNAIPDANAVTIRDYASDVRAWVAATRQRTGGSCVWVLGHSEGALVALVAAQEASDICGLMLVSAAGRPLGDVLREQLAASPATMPLLGEADAVITRLEAGQTVVPGHIPPALHALFRPEVQGFLISAFVHDPARLIRSARGPVLILQGLRDIQVGRGDAERLGHARADAKLVLLPEANHVLKRVTTDDRSANIAAYLDPDMPLAPGVVDALAGFIEQQGRGR